MLSDDSGDAERQPPCKMSRLSYWTSDDPIKPSEADGVLDPMLQQEQSDVRGSSMGQEWGRNWLKKFSIRRDRGGGT